MLQKTNQRELEQLTENAAAEIEELEVKIDQEQEKNAQLEQEFQELRKDAEDQIEQQDLKHEEELARWRKDYEAEIEELDQANCELRD